MHSLLYSKDILVSNGILVNSIMEGSVVQLEKPPVQHTGPASCLPGLRRMATWAAKKSVQEGKGEKGERNGQTDRPRPELYDEKWGDTILSVDVV